MLTTSCRTRRLQCLDPLLVRSLQQPRTLDGGRRARSFLGGVVLASVYASTRWRCGQRGSVLPNVALRSVRVSSLLVLLRHRGNGGCKLGFWGAVEGRAANGRRSKDGQLMADDRHTSTTFVAPHVASKYDLLPHHTAFQPYLHSRQTAVPPALPTPRNHSICTNIVC